ncbi:RNA-binding protein [Oleiharenicola lentus]|uniref:RNA-binding protein n=2 Tax=Oleiharenicola lentus TaxID=2508720 RepID=A0A4Q1C6D5_9BACT|nr:RNA-binding protein [Oleiharenicola lentus]
MRALPPPFSNLRCPPVAGLLRTVPPWVALALLVVTAPAAEGLVAEPLAPRSPVRGPTLFATLAPGDTGIVAENRYADPRMWTDRYSEIIYGPMGTGVAIGDYDGDGRPDVFIVSKTEQSRLFRNHGNWKFEDVTAKSGIVEPGKPAGWTQGAAFADVDNDGRLDLYLCRFGVPNQLFMNRGDGTFREEAAARGLAVTDASGMGAFCDYDRDGDLDVYLQTNLFDTVKAPQGQKDYLFRNRGDGTYEEVTTAAGIAPIETAGHSATWWDYDGDGWPDLYVANDYAVPDFLYRNNRDGTFTNVINEAIAQTPHSSMGSDLGDADNDGRVDLFVADMAATTREKDQRGMAKIRAMLDSAVHPTGEAFQFMRNALHLGTGTARLREGAQLAGIAATDWTWSVRFDDFDNDGRIDLHVTNGMIREYHNADQHQVLMALENPADSRRAMQAAPVFAERNLAFRNEGALRFREVGTEWGLGQLGVSLGAATGDLDGDGDLDLIYANYQSGPTVLRNDSDTGHRLVIALRGTTSNRFGVGATVRIKTATGEQVRTLVLARGYLSTSEPVLHFGLGSAERVQELTVEWPSGHRQSFGNLAADQKLTLIEPAGPARPTASVPPAALFQADSLGLVSREQPEADANAQPFQPFTFDRRGPALAVLPVGKGEQLLLGGTTRDPLRGFSADNLDDGPLLVFEANGDGVPDLLQTKAGTSRPFGPDYQPKLHLGTPTGFTPAALPAIPQSTGAATAADLDRDGDLDAFLGARVLPGRYPLTPRSVLLRNDGGTFTELPLPENGELGLVTSAVFSDLDQDGWPDLILATEWGTVRYLHNDAGKAFTDRSVAQGFTQSGFWSSLVAADFNGDGRPDFAVGNLGLNTPYHSGPAILFHGRFGDGGPPSVIEATQEDGKLFPRRSRNELGGRIAGLLRRYPRHNEFAKIALPEIVGAERLARARRFDATELRSGVYLSQPTGPHRFVPLPWEVQLAPVQGMVALDLTGDGFADLALGQNSHSPTPSLGRFTGGLGVILVNDGRGDFRALDPQQSGFIVPGDVRALVVADLDGDARPELVASRSEQPVLAFLRSGFTGHQPLRVVLQGPSGNPTAIGARVTLTLADGSVRTAEVAAASGYYSQSSPAAFFWLPVAPRSLAVTWPDGRVSTHAIESNGSAHLVIAAPR